LKITNAVKKGFMITTVCFRDWNGLVAGNGYLVNGIYKTGDGKVFIKVMNVFKNLDESV
jgi:hypothetical protein